MPPTQEPAPGAAPATSTRTITYIVLAIIIIGGLWWYFSSQSAPTTNTASTAQVTGETAAAPSGGAESAPAAVAPAENTVTYTDNGFWPDTLTVKAGTKVTFVNQSSSDMWVATNAHPDHTGYDGTTRAAHCAAGYAGPTPFDECKAGGENATYSFVFTKAGTWDYHNHAASSDTGTVIVQ